MGLGGMDGLIIRNTPTLSWLFFVVATSLALALAPPTIEKKRLVPDRNHIVLYNTSKLVRLPRSWQ
jgi:hypothetical protein